MYTVCVCVCVLGKEGSRMFASRALLVEQTAVYLTGYCDCLPGILKPLLQPYKLYISQKLST